MKIKLKVDNRGPINSIHEVYIKLLDDDDDEWYIIAAVEGYHRDDSRIEERDNIVYQRPDATRENGFIRGEQLPLGFSFVPRNHCTEVDNIKSNKEAAQLLDNEY